MQFGVGGVDTHADSNVDWRADRRGSTDSKVWVWAQWAVRISPTFEGESDDVVAAVGDGPEEHLQRRGSCEEIVSEKGMQLVVGAREGG